jgi:hypothetical protein
MILLAKYEVKTTKTIQIIFALTDRFVNPNGRVEQILHVHIVLVYRFRR